MKILRHASAIWSGSVPTGAGTMTLGRDGLTIPFSLKSRTEEEMGTNPEELLGAALAACFSMHMTSLQEEDGKEVGVIQTSARVTLEQREDGFWISAVHLIVRGSEQSMSLEEFIECAQEAKRTCPVSKLYSTAVITLDAALT